MNYLCKEMFFSKMADDSFFLIDIERILQGKLGKKYKYVPGFLVSYLKRIVHQDELNVFLRESKDKVGVDFLEALLDVFLKAGKSLPFIAHFLSECAKRAGSSKVITQNCTFF